jgi:hypothetical protein
VPQLIAGCGEAGVAPVQDVDGACVDEGPDVLAGDADGKIVVYIDVEVTTDQRRTEGITRAGDTYHRRAVLVP